MVPGPQPTSSRDRPGPEVGQQVAGRVLRRAPAVGAQHAVVMAMGVGDVGHPSSMRPLPAIGKQDCEPLAISLPNGRIGVAAHLRGHLPFRVGQRRGRPAEPVPAGGQPAAGLPSSAGSACPCSSARPGGWSRPGGAASCTPRWPTRSTGSSTCWSGWTADGRPAPTPSIRLGSSAEFFSSAVVPRLGPDGPALVARFGSDDEILDLLEHGELDVAVTSATPGRRSLGLHADRHQAVRAGRRPPRSVPPAAAAARWPTWARGWWASPGWPTAPSCP